MKNLLGRFIPLIVLGTLFVLQSGCDNGPDIAGIVGEANQTHIQKVSNAYKLYQLRNNKAVSGKDELIEFIKTSTEIEKNLGWMKIDKDDFEKYFVSERDGEEFLIRWNVWINDRAAPQPLTFEKNGVEGKRQVFWTPSQEVEDCDKTRYEELLKGKFERKDMDREYRGGAGQGIPEEE